MEIDIENADWMYDVTMNNKNALENKKSEAKKKLLKELKFELWAWFRKTGKKLVEVKIREAVTRGEFCCSFFLVELLRGEAVESSATPRRGIFSFLRRKTHQVMFKHEFPNLYAYFQYVSSYPEAWNLFGKEIKLPETARQILALQTYPIEFKFVVRHALRQVNNKSYNKSYNSKDVSYKVHFFDPSSLLTSNQNHLLPNVENKYDGEKELLDFVFAHDIYLSDYIKISWEKDPQ